tara:strand:- start:18798 stop:23261 length:4464 start_codon:yes stop_codon:yes gene_type:complete
MGLSFDLKVEELPHKILDLAFASHAWFDRNTGAVIGFAENALEPDGTVAPGAEASVGWTEGYLDIISTSRWAGLQPVPGSWVINDIKTANGTVFLCGSYSCQWKGVEWQAAGLDAFKSTLFNSNNVHPSFGLGGFVDGFFACCKYDQLENPKAWHILPMRSLIETPEMEYPPNAFKPVFPINGYVADNTQGGLYDMVIDIRTENPSVKKGWGAETAETFGDQPQAVVVTCVGYMPCEDYGTTVHNSAYMTESYKWSIYENQDFLPVVYSFVVNIFDDKYNEKDLYMSYGENSMINPFYTNSQLSFQNSGFGGNENEDPLLYWNYNWLIGGLPDGQNPTATDGYGGIDWVGSSLATNGAFMGVGDQRTIQDSSSPANALNIPYSNAAGRYGSLQVYPFEQVSYRAHQIGVETSFDGPIYYPTGSLTGTWIYSNKTPRQPVANPFWPTPFIGTFPIRKPVEMAFGSPNYAAFKTQVYEKLLVGESRANSAKNEFCPQPNYYNPSMAAAASPYSLSKNMAQTDAEIWRHGFIPRRLTGIERSFNSFAYATDKGGLYYPTYQFDYLYGLSTSSDYFTSAISYLVFTGDCLEDDKTLVGRIPKPNAQLTCAVSGGRQVYSPLCVVANMGQSIAGGNQVEAQYVSKGLPYLDTGLNPIGENYGCNTWFKCLTRRNISVEDVNAENYFATAPENTSLDFATFVKPLATMRAGEPATHNQIFNINLLLQSNETVLGTNERRAEIYTLQPWILNDQISGLPFDMNAIVPFMTHEGMAEAIIEDALPAPPPTTNFSWLPNEWTYNQTQGIPLSIPDVNKQRNCFHRYIQDGNYQYSQPTGLGQMLLGYWDNRTTPSGGPETGPQVMVFDPGTQTINIDNNEDPWVANTFNPTWGGIYRFGLCGQSGFEVGTTGSPGIYDYWDLRINAAAQTNNSVPNQLYSLPTTNQTKTGSVTLPNAWQTAIFNWKLTINGADFNGLYPGATAPPPSYTYTTLDSLVIDLNTALAYLISAGAPYSSVFGTGVGQSLFGLAGLTFYACSDRQGIYLRVDTTGQSGNNNVSMGSLIIGSSVTPWIGAPTTSNEYYPWNSASPDSSEQWEYAAIQGPVTTFDPVSGRQGGVAVVNQPTISELKFNLQSYGDTFNSNCPGGATTTRRPACADYDLDRAQWMVTFADNDKAVSEIGNGFSAISTTADFDEFLDQTKNFFGIPDFFNLATYLGVANTAIYANSLWAARQGSSTFDGIVWVGAGDPLTTRSYPPGSEKGLSSSTYVWANWWCDTLPVVGLLPTNPDYSYAGPECLGGAPPANAWTDTLFEPLSPDWGATGITPICYKGSQPYVIVGTTGRTVQVWLNYVLYDGIDSIIAVELQNLGLRVTPENVEWYKRKIMGQEGAEMSLEEIEEWMELQRNQYQDILKQRNRNYRMRQRPDNRKSATESLENQLAGDFYALDEESISELLPQLNKLPPNPDTDVMMDVDAFGNTSSGDIQKTEEKRRDSED